MAKIVSSYRRIVASEVVRILMLWTIEILNPKHETISNDQNPNDKYKKFWTFRNSNSGHPNKVWVVVPNFDIRILNLLFLFCLLLFTFYPSPTMAIDIHGFSEVAFGSKFGDERADKDGYNLLEGRIQLKSSYFPEKPILLSDWNTELFFKGAVLLDGYEEDVDLNIREGYLFLSPVEFMDIKLGRQILTWGTGDLLFINDLFPKDFVSFFIGRDDEYLKIPSDAGRFSLFSRWASFDLVLIPFFEPDNTITGKRLSFFDSFEGEVVGVESKRVIVEQVDSFDNTEVALRVYRNFGSVESAIYGFRGFFKQPRGISNPNRFEVFYPRLNVYGFSIRGPLLKGIINIEVGYYDSREDSSGGNRLIENSSIKYLLGYERDFGGDFKTGIQYFLEEMLDYEKYKSSLQTGDVVRDEFRHLLALRLTKLFKGQTMETSLFTFYSPSDGDMHLRPRFVYNVTDNWKVTLGANIFSGKDDFTEFGQLEGNNNIYSRVRYSF